MACAHQHQRCIDSRPFEGGRYRRYHCPTCGRRQSTIEVEVELRETIDETIAEYRRRQAGELPPEQIAALQIARARIEEICRALDNVTRKDYETQN